VENMRAYLPLQREVKPLWWIRPEGWRC